ncbi:ribonuclease Z [Lentimicrobium sp.]|uniref:ribonuclease Z n=4 Tax=Lentimicrobium sp. TaxID=2034841 RepID=UPI002B8955A6|nr:ribonuclease Z [Lentimicrobium sp.]MCO5262670.1 ribonuclease Z [Lentimicrobium sp.]HPR24919.1 ribonuclease Z [Lentimicrobium sp.]
MMKKFEVTILGSSAALPTRNRNLSAQVVNYRDRLFLIDCGEGTQMHLKRNRIRMGKINHIFISHLHGDHFYGLIGLVSTYHLLGRREALHVYGPEPLEQIISIQLDVSSTTLQYPLVFHVTQHSEPEEIFNDGRISVTTLPLLHRVPTTGFLFRELPHPRKLIREAADRYGVPVSAFEDIRAGNDYVDEEGNSIPNSLLTRESSPVRSYAYCSDTGYHEPVAALIRNCDLLYHEATFMQDMLASAREKQHATAADAATIAKLAGAKRLLLGHFSARYEDLQPLLDEAKAIFSQTGLVEDDATYEV